MSPVSLSDDTATDEAKPGKKSSKEKTAATKEKLVGKAEKAAKREWPKGREAQAKAVLAMLRDCDGSVTPDKLAKQFSRAQSETIDELL